jgi:polyisoprenoid-binding protein YceI
MTLSLRVAGLAGAAFLALAAAAQAQPAGPAPDEVQAGAYAIEPFHTKVLFSLSHLGFTTWYGEFGGASGRLVLDPKHLDASSLDVSVPVASVNTNNAKLDEELKSADWIDATKFPAMTFHSTHIVRTGPTTADVDGELTIHGVTHREVLHAKFNRAGVNMMDKAYTTGFEVSGVIKRSDFGVSKYVPVVGDDVTLIISAAFEKK